MAHIIKVFDTPKWIPAVWVPPPPEWWKLKVPRDQTTGYGGILRVTLGQLIMTFSAASEVKNSLQA